MRKDRKIQGSDSSLMGMDWEPHPGDLPTGSVESRAAARAKLEHIKSHPGEVIRVQVFHIGYDGKSPLPPPSKTDWSGGKTIIEHVGGEVT
jgi:hypothetical protein